MCRALAVLVLALLAGPAFAVDPSTAQQDCQDIRDAAIAAQVQAIKDYTAGRDPGQVFQEATEACLKNIIDYSKFEFRMPSLGDLQGKLKQMGDDLIISACQAAKDQFNRSVQEATAELGGLSTNLPGYGDVGLVQTGTGTVSAGSGGVTTSGSPVTMPKDEGIISSVINWFKGGSSQEGKP